MYEKMFKIVLTTQKSIIVNWQVIFLLVSILILSGISQNASASENNDLLSEDNSESPILGVDSKGKKIVSKGISYNEYTADVERHFTPFPLITVNIGETNKANFKIYDPLGPENIRHFTFAFGLDKNQIISKSNAIIELDISFDGTETVTITDPENVLDNVNVITDIVDCNDTSELECLNVTIYHMFRAPLDFNIVATDVWNTKRNAWQNYYNHGIEIVGTSLNSPKIHDGFYKGQIYHLTETSKTTAVDEFDNTWSLRYGQWSMDYIPNKKIVDAIGMNGYDRNHALFDLYKHGQYLLGEKKLRQICLKCFDEPYDKINDIFAYDLPKYYSTPKLEHPAIQYKLMAEGRVSEQKLDALFKEWYPAMVFD